MLRSLIAGVRALLRPAERNAQIEEELKSFFDASVEDKIRSGMSPETARRAAHTEIASGEMIRHKVWSAGWESRVDAWLREPRVAARSLRRSPGFAVTAVLMLAFGIGATTAIFSIVESVLMRSLPFPKSDRLVILSDVGAGQQAEWGVTAPEITTYQRDTQSFSALGGYTDQNYELSGRAQPAVIDAARMTAGVFIALGVVPQLGRVFTAEECNSGEQVVVISYGTWVNRFDRDPNIVGAQIQLDRKPYTIIGVMPRGFEFPLVAGQSGRTEMWIPMTFSAAEKSPSAAGNWAYQMVGRLKPGIGIDLARNDVDRVGQEIMRSFPSLLGSIQITPVVRTLKEETVKDSRKLLSMLFLSVAVVLLIACANFAGLMLVRAIQRRHEYALRLAIGARAWKLIRQTVTESLLICFAGGLIGLIFATVAIKTGKALLPESLPRIGEIGLDWRVTVFSLLLSIATGVVCGFVPAWAVLRTNMNENLREGGRSGTGGRKHGRLSATLVVGEIAVAMMLVSSACLLLRSFEKMAAVELGYQPDHLLTAAYGLPEQSYPTQAKVDNFNRVLLERLRQLPGAKAAALTSLLPTAEVYGRQELVAEGYTPRKGEKPSVVYSQVEGNFFPAFGISLLRGRTFTDADGTGKPLVAIVNRSMARHFWPNQSPIGKRIRIGPPEAPTPWMTVVGEVVDAKLGSPDQPTREQYYSPSVQLGDMIGSLMPPGTLLNNGGFVALRTTLPPETMENSLRETVRSLDPQLPLSQMQTMDEVVAQSEGPRRFNTAVVTTFALAAVLLAGLGIYSIVAFSVASRMQEMAIRIALGSQRGDILRLVLISGTKLAAMGVLIGLAGAAVASSLVRSFLFEVSPFDPPVLVLAAIMVLALALVASAMPARRAAAVNPINALRGE
ncbi:MAG: ABC transporter permease [Acidobacteriaceae bacterium]